MPEAYQALAATVITFFDSSTVASVAWFLYVNNDMIAYLRCFYYVGLGAFGLYLLFVPESPRWLLMKDPHSKEAIKILNYIAWFNGSKLRVPEDAILDQVGQVIEEDNQINKTTVGRL